VALISLWWDRACLRFSEGSIRGSCRPNGPFAASGQFNQLGRRTTLAAGLSPIRLQASVRPRISAEGISSSRDPQGRSARYGPLRSSARVDRGRPHRALGAGRPDRYREPAFAVWRAQPAPDPGLAAGAAAGPALRGPPTQGTGPADDPPAVSPGCGHPVLMSIWELGCRPGRGAARLEREQRPPAFEFRHGAYCATAARRLRCSPSAACPGHLAAKSLGQVPPHR